MATSNKIVSIVEDEVDIKNLFYDALSMAICGVSVLKFCDSLLALNHFRTYKLNYGLVIADWRMPKLNGLDLLKTVKKLNPNVKSMLISAYEVENEPLFEKYMKKGIIDKFIQKPVKIEYLCNEVNNQVQG